jgi:hypothetical protein
VKEMHNYDKLDVEDLIIKTRERDDFAFSELVRRYTPMINKVISGFSSAVVTYDEAFSEACVALHKASLSYRLDLLEVTFGLYARICVKRRLSDLYSAAKLHKLADDVDVENLNVKMLHLGYFLLLDKVDSGDGIRILKAAKENGIETSIDLVSENSDRYSIVIPALPYTDYLIINEVEASNLTGIEPTNENLEKISEKIMALGVKKKVIIHKPDVSSALSKEGFTLVPSYEISKDEIKGTTGAGDAFCAGALIGIYDNLSDKEILEFASAVAMVSLFAPDATGGICSEDIIRKISKNKERKKICL